MLMTVLDIRILRMRGDELVEPFNLVRRMSVTFEIYENLRDHLQLYYILFKELRNASYANAFRVAWEHVLERSQVLDEYVKKLYEMEVYTRRWVHRVVDGLVLTASTPRTGRIKRQLVLKEDDGLHIPGPVLDVLLKMEARNPLPYKANYKDLKALVLLLVQLMGTLKSVGVERYEDLMYWQSVSTNVQALIWVSTSELVKRIEVEEWAKEVEYLFEAKEQLRCIWIYLEKHWALYLGRLRLLKVNEYDYQDATGETRHAEVYVPNDPHLEKYVEPSIRFVNGVKQGVKQMIVPKQ